MPSLGSHLGKSREVAVRIGDGGVDRHRGPFFLGATAPDIRVMLRVDRRHTHFFDLSDHEPQDSVARMFEQQPRLRNAAALDGPTRAFVAGYLTHLLMDEHYIQNIYRACFGGASPLGGEMRANVLDRALQYEMNRRELADLTAMNEVRTVLEGCAVPGELGFIEAGSLREWLDVAVDFSIQPPDYERFPRMMTRHMEGAGYSAEQIADTLADAVRIIDEAFEYVGEDRVRQFLDESVEIATARVREYLRGDGTDAS